MFATSEQDVDQPSRLLEFGSEAVLTGPHFVVVHYHQIFKLDFSLIQEDALRFGIYWALLHPTPGFDFTVGVDI
jgi:hypothetical protein